MTINVSWPMKAISIALDFLHEFVMVETCLGIVEGRLKHVDYALSKHSERPYAHHLILENGNRLFIVRTWKVIKKA